MIDYNDEKHEYSHQGIIYTSVTTLIGQYKQPFNAKEVATAYAKKHGKTPEYWIAEWEKTKNEACARGTAFHLMKEELDATAGAIKQYDKAFLVQNQNQFSHLRNPFTDYPDGLYVEAMVWNHFYFVAGRVDKLLIETVGDKRIVHIDDYKTNKKIDRESYYDTRTRVYKMMKFPLHNTMDCNLQHYTLQLSLYAYMLKCFGFEVGKLRILHKAHEPIEGFGEPDEEIIELEYREDDIVSLLKIHREKQIESIYSGL